MRKISLTEKQSKFAREVGSVVLGVLIALGIGEVAEAARWKVRISSSMAAMRAELGGNRYNLVERRAYQDCVEKRLTDIGQVLQAARRTGILPDVREVGRPGLRLNESAAFEVAKSEGILLHMRRKQARDLSGAYGGIEAYRAMADEEQSSWRPLQLLQGAPGPISDDLLTDLLQAWASASDHSFLMGLIVQQQDDLLGRLGFAVEYNAEEPDRSALTKGARGRAICQPMIVNGKPVSRTASAQS
jgi:hypothetical protein